MYCKYCGAELQDDARFCAECGNNIEVKIKENNIAENNKQPGVSKKTLIAVILSIIVVLALIVGGIIISRAAEKDESVELDTSAENDDVGIAESDFETENIADDSNVETDISDADEIEDSENDSKIENEDSTVEDTKTSDENEWGDPYEIRMILEYTDDNTVPDSIVFAFDVDGITVYTGDLMHRTAAARTTYDIDSLVILSQEHLLELRNAFIEMYDLYYAKYQEQMYETSSDRNIQNMENQIVLVEGFPETFIINIGGKKINFAVEETDICISLRANITRSDKPDYLGNLYDAEFILSTRTDGLEEFTSYLSSMISEDDGQVYDFYYGADYGFIDNVIRCEKPGTDAQEENQTPVKDNKTEAKEETKASSIVGTWYSTSDDTVITFDASGNYTSNNPTTGEHSSLRYYNAGGNRYTAFLEDYFDVDYYLNGDTLTGEEGTYVRK